MFENRRFEKKFPLLIDIIQDKETRKELLNDEEFIDFYNKNVKTIEEFKNNLLKIYDEEKYKKIFFNVIMHGKDKLEEYSEKLFWFIHWTNKDNNNDLSPIKNLSWETVVYSKLDDLKLNIEETVLNLCFNYYPKEIDDGLMEDAWFLKKVNVVDLFYDSNIGVKRILLSFLKENKINTIVDLVNQLKKSHIDTDILEFVLENEVSLDIFSDEVMNYFGKKDYLRLIKYVLKNPSSKSIKIINRIIQLKNYDLLSDLIILGNPQKYVIPGEEDHDISSLSEVSLTDYYYYINNKLSIDTGQVETMLKAVLIDNNDEYNEKYREVIDLFKLIHQQNNEEDFLTVIKYIKTLDKDSLKDFKELIQNCYKDAIVSFKNEYATKINKTKEIAAKATEQAIKDSKGNTHNVKIYELKDEEPFMLLITVMNRKARKQTMNMYGRPAHESTINNPALFCSDLQGGSEIISTSLISNIFVETFVGPYVDLAYVFGDLEADDFLGISFCDGAFSPKIDSVGELFEKNGAYGACKPSELIMHSKQNRDYNEIAIKRKRNGKKILPTAILCFNEVNDVAIKHAEYFNIPIIIINTRTYRDIKGFSNQVIAVNEENKRRGR